MWSVTATAALPTAAPVGTTGGTSCTSGIRSTSSARSSGSDEGGRAISGGRGGVCILRAPGGPVDLDRDPAGCGPRFDQFERPVPAGVREQPRALADDHGIGEQGDLVDQLVVDEPADQVAAAVHLQLTRRLGFQ